MRKALEVSAWVKIREDCAISYSINGDDDIELLFGGPYDGFELILPTGSLPHLINVVTQALAEAEPQD